MYEATYNRLDLYITMIIETQGLDYVAENYIVIREEYYENKNGG